MVTNIHSHSMQPHENGASSGMCSKNQIYMLLSYSFVDKVYIVKKFAMFSLFLILCVPKLTKI